MSRFGSETDQTIDEAIGKTVPINTVNSKKCVWKQFLTFCYERKFEINSAVTAEQLGSILKDWSFNMKRKNGEDYKESVIKVMWNSTAKQLQEFCYNNFGMKFNPFSDIEFKSARDARDAKRRILQVDPSKRKSSSAALTTEELSKVLTVWNEDNPIGLQRKFFHVAGYELAWRGGEASTCCVHHFCQEIDNAGIPTGRIQYNPLFTKTTQGGAKKLADSKWLTKNTINVDICPVR